MRRLLSASAAVAVWLSAPACALAQGAYPLADGWSGPGFYLAWWKVLLFWLIFLCWVRSSDWVSQDLQELKALDYKQWNPIVVGSFMGAFVLAWLIPIFWVGLFLLLVAWAAPLSTYIVLRNKQVTSHEKVMTPAHLRYWFAQKARFLGMKVEAEARDPHESGPPVVLTARGADERKNNIHLLSARQAPGFREARQIIADGLAARGDAVMLDYSQQGVSVRYLIDGVWHDGQTRDRESSDPALEALKILCGLNPQDRQNRQEGLFNAELRQKDAKPDKIAATLGAQGTATGERVLVQFERKKTPFANLDELGMRTKMQEQLREALGQPAGFVLLSALPATGLRSTTNLVIRSLDRFMREFVALEDASNRYEAIENVPVTTYPPEKKNDLAEIMDRMFHQEPSAVVIRDLVDAKMVELMFEQIANNRMFISTIRAKDCADAIARLLAMNVPQAEVARHLTAVLNQRLIRKLCEKCKEAYAPTPEVLAQLQIPEGKVQAFYRPPTPNPEQPKEVCTACNGIGYFGRTALYEFLLIDDSIRKVLATNPRRELIYQAGRAAGMRTMQEEGILLVAKGVTSLPELMRVLKL